MPMMPFAPKVATVSSEGPVLEQSDGTVLKFDAPITCTGNELAVSPETCKSAKATGPQL